MRLCHRGTLKLIEMMSQRTKDEDAWGGSGISDLGNCGLWSGSRRKKALEFIVYYYLSFKRTLILLIN
jgi:hypothetical protein